jgi:hypothetical protein
VTPCKRPLSSLVCLEGLHPHSVRTSDQALKYSAAYSVLLLLFNDQKPFYKTVTSIYEHTISPLDSKCFVQSKNGVSYLEKVGDKENVGSVRFAPQPPLTVMSAKVVKAWLYKFLRIAVLFMIFLRWSRRFR